MGTKLIQKEQNFTYFFLLFIALQPVLDLLTSLSIQMLHMDATLSIVVRFNVMLLAMIYLFIYQKNKKPLVYICLLGVIMAAGLLNNLVVKHPISLGEEVKFMAKCMYPIVMLFGYILVFKTLQNKQNSYDTLLRYFLYASLFMSIVMAISIATGTDYQSYSYTIKKIGSKGWFYAANEISAILAITFPVVVLYSIYKTTSFTQVYYWIPTILALYASIMVGTKVGYVASIVTLGVALFFSFIEYMMKRGRPQLVNTILALIVLGGVTIATPFTPIAKNMEIHLQFYNKRLINEQEEQPSKQEERALTTGEVNSLIYSDRDKFLNMQQKFFQQSPLSQKLLGMGYAGNYEKTPKVIEMDFHDLFFSFGIIGFILYLLPFVYFGIRLTFRILTNFKSILTVKYMLLGTAIVLAIGIAFSAGHVFTAPAVSIFFVVLLAYLIVDLQAE
ncbi:O-antigen ligase family protein [Bacillus cereus group sp. BfR-BA-01380]|uniref:O-antigen ligase family protein n=1 Tax=Bacillus cereus group sp. BfR-BA-01380 TaxID=2920324 RepID=UPI001F573FB5|nr:O-antigen ligase family protein [Bacillus cereus group sp. BfR-BA-01380]